LKKPHLINRPMIYWIYLFIASLFEIGWMISLRAINFSSLKNVSIIYGEWLENMRILLPFVGYAFFGLGNIYFFSIASKQIPPSVAFAVWMGVALCGLKIIEISFYKQPSSVMDYFFMAMILISIIGLKTGKP